MPTPARSEPADRSGLLLLGRAFRRFLTEGQGDAAVHRHLDPDRRTLVVDPGYSVDLTDAEADAVADVIDGRPQPEDNAVGNVVHVVVTRGEARLLAMGAQFIHDEGLVVAGYHDDAGPRAAGLLAAWLRDAAGPA